jgi:uncharacterized protein YecT (DUF1311 family)
MTTPRYPQPSPEPSLPTVKTAALLLLVCVLPAAAQPLPRPADRVTIDTCLQKEEDAPERCIGLVYKACTDAPGGSTTAGMGFCAQHETQVWQEKMEASLRQLLAGSLGQIKAEPWNRPNENKREHSVAGADIINDMQRAWLAWRAKMCDTAAMQYEGGSLSRVIYGDCIFRETARHALWLAQQVDDNRPR